MRNDLIAFYKDLETMSDTEDVAKVKERIADNLQLNKNERTLFSTIGDWKCDWL